MVFDRQIPYTSIVFGLILETDKKKLWDSIYTNTILTVILWYKIESISCLYEILNDVLYSYKHETDSIQYNLIYITL